jgi:hypothetical protein
MNWPALERCGIANGTMVRAEAKDHQPCLILLFFNKAKQQVHIKII